MFHSVNNQSVIVNMGVFLLDFLRILMIEMGISPSKIWRYERGFSI